MYYKCNNMLCCCYTDALMVYEKEIALSVFDIQMDCLLLVKQTSAILWAWFGNEAPKHPITAMLLN